MEFLEFLNTAVTPYHTVDCLKKAFRAAGFPEEGLFERAGALIAVRTPQKTSEKSKFRIALAHTDFPALKVSPNPDKGCAAVRTLHCEVYGSPLFTSWLDRDLSYAGLLAYECGGEVLTKLIRGEELFRIPELAIHLNRGVNSDGMKVNPQTDLDALWSSAEMARKFTEVLQSKLGAGEHLLDYDVQLFDAQRATLGGFNREWVYSGRLDNLSSCHAILEAMVASKPHEDDFLVAAFMNNEEVGSLTREGAAGNFLKTVLGMVFQRTQESCDKRAELSTATEALSSSLALSIDMAHAEHPNFPQKHEANHAPVLGGGVVLKTNSQKRYASDVLSSARFKLLCEKADVKYQTFITRNDIPCGSTVGPTISASLGIPTVDIGEPMLSMHSIREMTAIKDHTDMIQIIKTLYA